jgi:hypothetical protein
MLKGSMAKRITNSDLIGKADVALVTLRLATVGAIRRAPSEVTVAFPTEGDTRLKSRREVDRGGESRVAFVSF